MKVFIDLKLPLPGLQEFVVRAEMAEEADAKRYGGWIDHMGDISQKLESGRYETQ